MVSIDWVFFTFQLWFLFYFFHFQYLGKWYEMKWYSEVYFDESELFQDYTHEYIRKKGGNLTVLHTGRSVYAQHQFRCKETLEKKKAIYIIIYIYKWLISYSYYIKQFRMGVVKSAGWSFLDNLNLFQTESYIYREIGKHSNFHLKIVHDHLSDRI